MTFLTSSSKTEKRTKVFLCPILKCHRDTTLPFQANLCSSHMKRTHHMSTTSHVLLVLGSDHSEAEKDYPRMTPYAPKPHRIPCMKPDFQCQPLGDLATLISMLQGSSTPCTLLSRQLLACIHSLLLLLHSDTQILL